MNVRPFTLIGNRTLEEVSARLQAVAEEWCSAWGLGDLVDMRVTCLRAMSQDGWQRYSSSNDRKTWFLLSNGFANEVRRAMFAPDQGYAPQAGDASATIATAAGNSAVDTLCNSIASLLGPSVAVQACTRQHMPDRQVFAYASGAVVACIVIGEQTLTCLLNRHCVQALDTRQSSPPVEVLKKINLVKILEDVPVSLSVSAGQVEVEVGNLMMLAQGDVVRLQSSVDRPLTLLGPDGSVLCAAYLGKTGSSMAIEVAPYNQ